MVAARRASATPATPSSLHACQPCCNLVGALPACLLHFLLHLACKLPYTLHTLLNAAGNAPGSIF